eukprot:g29446.t1
MLTFSLSGTCWVLGGLGWMLPQGLARRAAVDVQLTATAIQCLKTAVLGPDVVHQLEDAQMYGGIPSARTPARTEFHIGPGIPYLPAGACAPQPELPPEHRPSPLLLVTLQLLIFGHQVRRGTGGSEDPLVGLLLGLAKLIFNRSRQRAVEGFIYTDCLPLFRARVSLEKEHM